MAIETIGGPLPENLPNMAERDSRFRKDLEHLINSHSRENGSNTPDFILAEFLGDCLAAWDKNVSRRSQWYGGRDKIGG